MKTNVLVTKTEEVEIPDREVLTMASSILLNNLSKNPKLRKYIGFSINGSKIKGEYEIVTSHSSFYEDDITNKVTENEKMTIMAIIHLTEMVGDYE